MVRDITIGQHLPGSSIVHRLDPRLKILLTLAFIVMLFVGNNPLCFFICIVALVALYRVAGIPGKMAWKSFRPLMLILVFTTLLNIFFVPGEALVSWGWFTITKQGIYYAVMMVIRILILIAGSSLLTYTTSPILLTDAIERLLFPVAKLGFPAHELAMMMTIALRMIPTLIEETDKIMNAQKARGANLDSGRLTARVRALVPVLIPLFLSAFRRADDLAMAMECRCYRGGEGRTRLRQLKFRRYDGVALAVCVAVFVLIGFSDGIFQQFFPALWALQR